MNDPINLSQALDHMWKELEKAIVPNVNDYQVNGLWYCGTCDKTYSKILNTPYFKTDHIALYAIDEIVIPFCREHKELGYEV